MPVRRSMRGDRFACRHTNSFHVTEYSFNHASSVNLFRLYEKKGFAEEKRVEHATNQAEGLKLKEVIAFKLAWIISSLFLVHGLQYVGHIGVGNGVIQRKLLV